MHIHFIDKITNEEFVLGGTSFNFLNERNVFDDTNEDTEDYYTDSDLVFTTSKEKVEILYENIINNIKVDGLRSDIHDKLINFAFFIKNSNGVNAILD
jgi:hypothetical protein